MQGNQNIKLIIKSIEFAANLLADASHVEQVKVLSSHLVCIQDLIQLVGPFVVEQQLDRGCVGVVQVF